jgi:hypothetical protein
LIEEVEEEAGDGSSIQSQRLDALDNMFLVSGAGMEVVQNFHHGVHGKGVSGKISDGCGGSKGSFYSMPEKSLLMLLMSPGDTGAPYSNGVHHVDIETGKVVTEWRFQNYGTNIKMRDITNDSKIVQVEPSESTFLGPDDNLLCRWDAGSSSESLVLHCSH